MVNNITKATAKQDCAVFHMKEPNGISYETRSIIKGQVLEMPIFSVEKIEDKLLASILGERCVVFKDNGHYVMTYSGDFNYTT